MSGQTPNPDDFDSLELYRDALEAHAEDLKQRIDENERKGKMITDLHLLAWASVVAVVSLCYLLSGAI